MNCSVIPTFEVTLEDLDFGLMGFQEVLVKYHYTEGSSDVVPCGDRKETINTLPEIEIIWAKFDKDGHNQYGDIYDKERFNNLIIDNHHNARKL